MNVLSGRARLLSTVHRGRRCSFRRGVRTARRLRMAGPHPWVPSSTILGPFVQVCGQQTAHRLCWALACLVMVERLALSSRAGRLEEEVSTRTAAPLQAEASGAKAVGRAPGGHCRDVTGAPRRGMGSGGGIAATWKAWTPVCSSQGRSPVVSRGRPPSPSRTASPCTPRGAHGRAHPSSSG